MGNSEYSDGIRYNYLIVLIVNIDMVKRCREFMKMSSLIDETVEN